MDSDSDSASSPWSFPQSEKLVSFLAKKEEAWVDPRASGQHKRAINGCAHFCSNEETLILFPEGCAWWDEMTSSCHVCQPAGLEKDECRR